MLLLFTGQSGQTFVQRARAHQTIGMIDAKYDRPPRDVTIGEVALIASGMHHATAPKPAAGGHETAGVIGGGGRQQRHHRRAADHPGAAEDAMASQPEPAPGADYEHVAPPLTPAGVRLRRAIFRPNRPAQPPTRSRCAADRPRQKPRAAPPGSVADNSDPRPAPTNPPPAPKPEDTPSPGAEPPAAE